MNKIEQALQRARDTKALITGRGVVCRTAEMFSSLFPEKKAVIVADENTWKVAGKDAQKSLDDAGIASEKPYIFPLSVNDFIKHLARFSPPILLSLPTIQFIIFFFFFYFILRKIL